MDGLAGVDGLGISNMTSADMATPVGLGDGGSLDLLSPLTMSTSYTHSQSSQGYADGSNGMGGTAFSNWSGWGASGTHDGTMDGATTQDPRSGNHGNEDAAGYGGQEGNPKRHHHGMVGVW